MLGLTIKKEFISEELEQLLITEIDKLPWFGFSNSPSSRRTQHYGYSYDYRSYKSFLKKITKRYPTSVNLLVIGFL